MSLLVSVRPKVMGFLIGVYFQEMTKFFTSQKRKDKIDV
jgi:hypothetical protein